MGTTRRNLLLAALAAACGTRVQASIPADVAAELPGARLAGSGRLTFLSFHVYDARLWVTDGFSAAEPLASPLALEVEYARSLPGRRVAERSLEEMKRVPGMSDEQAQRWLAWMAETFPDVAPGDRLTGVLRPGESVRFLFNGRRRGELRDAEFARRFFSIWLGPQTSEPALRGQLLGLPR